MRSICKNRGFTLVELLVSVAITAILMVGMATFFSSTFRNMFSAREKTAKAQGQFVVNSILEGKFLNAHEVEQMGPGGSFAVIRNNMETGDLPFTYIGRDAERIVFKDFFVFNGRFLNEESTATGLNNAGGIVSGGMNNYYVTAPQENKIYNCPAALNSCTSATPTLNIPGLNQPMDIEMGTGAMYVADAGNNRVLAITNFTTPNPADVEEIATGLNYPTGLALYNDVPHNKKYLFVADTYNHLVKRIDLADNSIETVVGEGDDETCDPADGREHSARFCKLRFPTDVMIASGLKSYYVADTGNRRILQVMDPEPVLSDYEIKVSPTIAFQIKNIDFVFPDDITLSPDPILAGSSSNDLPHAGWLENVGTTVRFHLTAPMEQDFLEPVEVCTPDPPNPDICVWHDEFRGFYVDSDYNIFESGDSIKIGSESYTVTSALGSNPVLVSPNTNQVSYADGTMVSILNSFPAGERRFYLDLSNVVFGSRFNLIEAKIFDPSNTLVKDPADFQTLRVGDGVLGTFEDTIRPDPAAALDFPTGLGWNGAGLVIADPPDYDLTFPDYDYVSDFGTDSFQFDILDTATGKEVLQLDFSASLGKDAEDNELWQDYSLSSDVNP